MALCMEKSDLFFIYSRLVEWVVNSKRKFNDNRKPLKMKLITRKEWGMREPRRSYSSRVDINSIIIHHTGGKNRLLDGYSGVDSIRSTEHHHMDTNGWNAMGYHYLIGANGDVYEGRPEGVIGAHAKGHNADSIGIMLWGNFDLESPTPDQIESLVCLLHRLQGEHGIPDTDIKGHRDVGITSCPGKNLYSVLDSIKLSGFTENSKCKDDATKLVLEPELYTTVGKTEVENQLKDAKRQLLLEIGKLLESVRAIIQRIESD